jgi:hypothetical protein
MSELLQVNESTILIEEKFRGPPFSGNGGYVAGRVAALLNTRAPVEVTLRAPTPMDIPMDIEYRSKASVVVFQREGSKGETLIAEAAETSLELSVPAPSSWQETLAASPSSYSFIDGVNPLALNGQGVHPICFCCGAAHTDGLEVFAAPVQGGSQVAAIWKTKKDWAAGNGNLPEEYLWAAIDCPGQFAFMAGGIYTGMLGRLTAQIHQPAKAGDEYLVTGWRIGIEGKKHTAGTAIFTRGGDLVASAKALWIGSREMPDALK